MKKKTPIQIRILRNLLGNEVNVAIAQIRLQIADQTLIESRSWLSTLLT